MSATRGGGGGSNCPSFPDGREGSKLGRGLFSSALEGEISRIIARNTGGKRERLLALGEKGRGGGVLRSG